MASHGASDARTQALPSCERLAPWPEVAVAAGVGAHGVARAASTTAAGLVASAATTSAAFRPMSFGSSSSALPGGDEQDEGPVWRAADSLGGGGGLMQAGGRVAGVDVLASHLDLWQPMVWRFHLFQIYLINLLIIYKFLRTNLINTMCFLL